MCRSAAVRLLYLLIRREVLNLCLVNVVCCQVEVSECGLQLVQRIPTECDLDTNDEGA